MSDVFSAESVDETIEVEILREAHNYLVAAAKGGELMQTLPLTQRFSCEGV